ncbi:GntR family transcriptional regulator [uncultured Pseudokineococcus sp.]|uniref:GntR family transcriptional regulator n=1 Tax=uncultured Pseudokineococcus sp. TaxID=1642928 RepID=UPI00262A6CF7|nr:GntR family transcriptional regulator [uncultured Pseudokineococcus sp.]
MSAQHGPALPDQQPHPVDRALARPLWQQVREDLTRRVDAGAFGQSFPGEHDLTAQYGVSRQTVRMALRSLRETGVVSAARGRQPQVTAPGLEQPLGALYSLFASVEAAGMEQRSLVRHLGLVRDSAAATVLGLAVDADLVHLSRVRLADGQPLALDEVWMPAHAASGLLGADLTHTALYRELAERCGIHVRGGREQLQAVVVTPAEASLLAVPAGSSAFSIQRLGCAGGTPVEHRRTLVRGDRFTVTAQFAPSSGYQMSVGTTSTAPRPPAPPGPP